MPRWLRAERPHAVAYHSRRPHLIHVPFVGPPLCAPDGMVPQGIEDVHVIIQAVPQRWHHLHLRPPIAQCGVPHMQSAACLLLKELVSMSASTAHSSEGYASGGRASVGSVGLAAASLALTAGWVERAPGLHSPCSPGRQCPWRLRRHCWSLCRSVLPPYHLLRCPESLQPPTCNTAPSRVCFPVCHSMAATWTSAQ